MKHLILILTIALITMSCGEDAQNTAILIPNIDSIAKLPQGTPVGSFNGVTAYSNKDGRADRGTYGLEYQCVEYVSRYLKQAMNFPSSGILQKVGHAKDWWTRSGGGKLTRYQNGGSIAPQVNDAIVWIGGSWGHIGIIKEVNLSGGYIKVIQQNVYQNEIDGDYRVSLTREGSGYRLSSPELAGAGLTLAGWLRIPGSTASCQDECSYIGEPGCNGRRVTTCVNNGSCLVKQTKKTCGSGFTCSDGDCVTSGNGSGNGEACQASLTSSNSSNLILLLSLFFISFFFLRRKSTK